MTDKKTGFVPPSVSQKAGVAVAVYEGASKLYTTSKEYWRNHYAYSVDISEKDLLYSEVNEWLITTLPQEKHRSLMVSTSRTHRDGYADPDEGSMLAPGAKPLTIHFNENTPRTMLIEGHTVRVTLHKADGTENKMREPEYSRIEFVTRTYAAQQAILRQLEVLNSKRAKTRKAVLKMVNQWGGWTTRSDLPPRTLDSVALPPDQKSRVIGDLRTFLDAEDQYNRLAIPWHRGYMFYGPPGTGKTSLVKALANEFNLDLWYVSLSDLKAESSLLSLLSEVGPRSLLLLEDIDTMKITHDRDNSEQGTISMSSLLNTLDGVATPHGLITVMTTNRFDVLDPALTRAGRMDLVENIDFPSLDTLAEMYKHFYEKTPNWEVLYSGRERDVSIEGLATAQISEIMIRHMTDPEGASKAIIAKLSEKVYSRD